MDWSLVGSQTGIPGCEPLNALTFITRDLRRLARRRGTFYVRVGAFAFLVLMEPLVVIRIE